MRGNACSTECWLAAAELPSGPQGPLSSGEREAELLKKIGELTVERDFYPKGSVDWVEGTACDDRPGAAEPVRRRQCELLGVSRSGLYYEPVPTSPDELALMRRIDELHLKHPFYGSRKLSFELRKEGREANRKRVQRLMRLMGLEAMARKPKTSAPHPEHAVYPYLLRNLRISRVNQVWATDITYVPMKAGFVYLVAIMDWYSRRVPSWRVSNTLDSSFCVEALEEAFEHFGQPEIFSTDQGAQFTADARRECLNTDERWIPIAIGTTLEHAHVLGRGQLDPHRARRRAANRQAALVDLPRFSRRLT